MKQLMIALEGERKVGGGRRLLITITMTVWSQELQYGPQSTHILPATRAATRQVHHAWCQDQTLG